MDIFFQGQQNSEEAAETLLSVLCLFKERYKISRFREMHLSVTLVDEQGDDVELVDTETAQVYRSFQVYRKDQDQPPAKKRTSPVHLVVDNTKPL